MTLSPPAHPKLLDLADMLHDYLQEQGCPLPDPLCKTLAVGLLHELWSFTAAHAPAGDIGKHRDRAIARAVGWNYDAQWLIEALVELRLLDSSEEHRLIVHDWSHHAPAECGQQVADHGRRFADGTASMRKPRRNSPEGLRLRELQERKERAIRERREEMIEQQREAMDRATIQKYQLTDDNDRVHAIPVHRVRDEETPLDRETPIGDEIDDAIVDRVYAELMRRYAEKEKMTGSARE